MLKNNKKTFFVFALLATGSYGLAMEPAFVSPTPPNSPEQAKVQFGSQKAFNKWQKNNFEFEWQVRGLEFKLMSERGDFINPRSKDRAAGMEVRKRQKEEAIEQQKIADNSKVTQLKSVENIAQRKTSKGKVLTITSYDKAVRKVEAINRYFDDVEKRQKERDIRKNTLHPETLKFPSGRAVELVRAIKKQDIPVVIQGLRNPELKRHPVVELLKPVYTKKTSGIWVSEDLFRQVSYDEFTATAGLLALDAKNIAFMREYANEMRNQVTRRQDNLPVYRIRNS